MNNWGNELTRQLRIGYPIIQAPMLGITSPEMVAAISNEGGLGSLPVGGLSPEKTVELIRATKKLTNRPFAVNLFVHDMPQVDKSLVAGMQNFLQEIAEKNGIAYEKQDIDSLRFYSYEEQTDILLRENIPVVSFTFGILKDEYIQSLKNNGTVLIGTATSVEEAKLLDEKKIDIIVAQGIEAGGHRGTFLDIPLPQIGLRSLLPQIVVNTEKSVIAAGGIANRQTIMPAFELGAKGIQMGSIFLASDESLAIPSYKASVCNHSDNDTVLTRSFSGRWARSIRNRFITEVENSGLPIPQYPIQNSLTSLLRIASQKQDNKDFTSLYAGQSVLWAQAKPAAIIFRELVEECNTLIHWSR